MATIPRMDFRGNKFVNPDGTLTEVAQGFFDLLDTVLSQNIGQEALVAPTQSSTTVPSNILTIQNNVITSSTGLTTHTCQFGTFLYDIGINRVLVALSNSGAPPYINGTPIFKKIVTE